MSRVRATRRPFAHSLRELPSTITRSRVFAGRPFLSPDVGCDCQDDQDTDDAQDETGRCQSGVYHAPRPTTHGAEHDAEYAQDQTESGCPENHEDADQPADESCDTEPVRRRGRGGMVGLVVAHSDSFCMSLREPSRVEYTYATTTHARCL